MGLINYESSMRGGFPYTGPVNMNLIGLEASLNGINYFCVHVTVFYLTPPRWNDIIHVNCGVFEKCLAVIKQTAPFNTTLIVPIWV
jgi:hypothetical protein